jgi:hypothetical protein
VKKVTTKLDQDTSSQEQEADGDRERDQTGTYLEDEKPRSRSSQSVSYHLSNATDEKELGGERFMRKRPARQKRKGCRHQVIGDAIPACSRMISVQMTFI